VDPFPDPLRLRKSVAPGIEPGTSGPVIRHSDHIGGLIQTTNEVSIKYTVKIKGIIVTVVN
jgi:hypothetical protein